MLQSAGPSRRHGSSYQSTFVLKQAVNDCGRARSSLQATLICSETPSCIPRRIYKALDQHGRLGNQSLGDLVKDPFRIFLIVLMAWHQMNSKLFWALRDNLLGIETVNGLESLSTVNPQMPNYASMHLLSKDLIQTAELLELAVNTVTHLQQLHHKTTLGITEGRTSAIFEQTASALAYHQRRFEGKKARVEALRARIGSQISLVSQDDNVEWRQSLTLIHQTFNLMQQRDAKTSQRNSESVATISILTLFFLPATAIAVRHIMHRGSIHLLTRP